jgi:hypothetical protein
MNKILTEEILRIKSIMITENKASHLEFIEKFGFKLECTHCDSSPNPHSKKNLSYTEKQSLQYNANTQGTWNSYYLIINNKNSCSQFPLTIYDYAKSSWNLSNRANPVGDALIVVDFNFETKIIETAQVLLCDKLYTKEKYLNFKEVFKSNSPKNNNDQNDDSHDGVYWVWLENLTYQKMEEIINWINSGHQKMVQNLIKTDNTTT